MAEDKQNFKENIDKFSMIFTGDIEEEAEEALVKKYKNSNVLKSEILIKSSDYFILSINYEKGKMQTLDDGFDFKILGKFNALYKSIEKQIISSHEPTINKSSPPE